MLQEGVRLMIVGMTTVFAFLGVLVVAMHANRAVAGMLGTEPPPEPVPPAVGDDDAEIAVVLAAIAAQRGL
ncbi:MAG: OadG family protein [Myxococcales bacterium]|nr:OadG family protein [Myxococcales bacterium]